MGCGSSLRPGCRESSFPQPSGLPLWWNLFALLVDLLAALEHADELPQAALPGLGLLGLVQPVEDRIAIGAIQIGEGFAGGVAAIELTLEVGGDRGGSLPRVGGIPAPVGPGGLDLGQSGSAHPPGGDQRLGLLAVDPGPAAAGPPRREALEEVPLVQRPLLAVDPAE